MQRYKFNSCYRQPTETIAIFISELRSLGEFYNYGPLDGILHQHEKLFQEGLRTMQGYKARFLVDDKVNSKVRWNMW